MRNKWPLPAICTAALLLARCSTVSLTGGSDNPDFKVLGVITDENGGPAQGTQVMILPGSYNPATDSMPAATMVDTTDSSGQYRCAVAREGTYNIQAVNLSRRTRLLVSGISIYSDTTRVAEVSLSAPGAIKVALPLSINSLTGYVYVPGTTIMVFLNNRTDFVVLDSVPPGAIPAIYYSSINSAASSLIRCNVPVESGYTAVVSNPQWKYARKCILNTSPTGANVAGDIAHFPLLVRLDSGNFNFSQAQANGADLRFTKYDTAFLPYEIERWDAGNNRAEIWVNVDTVYGNNSTQSLVMYWGNPDAADSSNGAAVFDTGRGFVGVWHLGDVPAGDASIKDQTSHHYHGKPMGEFSPTDLVDGAIGKGLYFLGTDPTVYVGRGVKTGPVFTLATWIYSTIYEPQRFICDQNGYSLWYDNITKGFRLEYRDKSAWRGIPQDGGTVQPMTTGQWYYLTGTYDGDKVRLYINGTLATASGSIGSTPLASNDSLLIGSARHLEHVKGVMDEVRIENTPRSDDWIKLCYMNQKELDALVKW